MTVLWRVDEAGRLLPRHAVGQSDNALEPWIAIHRSIIRSCCRLDYVTAQKLVEGGEAGKRWATEDRPQAPTNTQDVIDDLKLL